MERREDQARAQAESVREMAGEEMPASENKVSAQKKQRALRGVGYVAVVAVFTALLMGARGWRSSPCSSSSFPIASA